MRSIIHFITNPKDLLSSLLKNFGNNLPDSLYLRWQYLLLMGCKLNLRTPRTFTEKIQWLKLNNRNPLSTKMVDKFAVKEFVAEQIGNEHIIPTLGVWDKFDDIDFDSLPNQFVLKTTHGGGNTGVIVVKNKSELDKVKAKRQLSWSMKRNGYAANREWPYKNVQRKIIAEKFLSNGVSQDLADYKWFCFNGEPLYCQVIRDRNTLETIDFYDALWQRQEFVGLNPKSLNPKIINGMTPVKQPYNLSKMIEIAKKLSHGQPFLRVDLYEVDQRIYFGELTFFPASGFGIFTPDEWNLKLGQLIKLPE